MRKEIVTRYIVPRVEGHGNVHVKIQDDKVTDVEFNLIEGQRFFESVIVGMPWDRVPTLMQRICAICTVPHNEAAIRAIERAMNVDVTEQTELLRWLMFHGSMIESHALHTYFLAAPDFLKVPDAVHLLKTHPEAVQRAIRMKKLGNDLQALIGGKPIHPEKSVVGGFISAPSPYAIRNIRQRLKDGIADAHATIDLFESIKYVDWTVSPTTYAAQRGPGPFMDYWGDTIHQGANTFSVSSYRDATNEKVVRKSSAKYSFTPEGKPFMVGSLARLLHNKSQLTDGTTERIKKSGKLPTENILLNSWAQAIEALHSYERAIDIIDELFSKGLKDEKPIKVVPRAGRGIAGVEAPRGMLIHEYETDANGKVTACNVITPTAMNQANIEKDMKASMKHLTGKPDREIEDFMETIVRAYDPCISCACHMVEVHFVR